MRPGTEVVEILARLEPTPGRNDRLIGRNPSDQFVLLEALPTGVAQQIGRASGFSEGVALATAVLDGDERALKWPHALHAIALTLVGATFSKEVKAAVEAAEAGAREQERVAEDARREAAFRAAKDGDLFSGARR